MTIGGKKISLTTQIFVAMIIGSIAGLICGDIMKQVAFIGTIWLNCVKMIVVPMVFFTIITGITSQKNLSSLGRIAGHIIAYYVLTTLVATVIGLAVTEIIRPGEIANFTGLASKKVAAATSITMAKFFTDMFTTNIFVTFTKGNILQTLIVAVFFGIAIMKVANEENKEMLKKGFAAVSDMVFSLITMVMKASPIGIFFLMADSFAKYGASLFTSMAYLAGTYYLACIIHVILVYGGILWISNGINPFRFIKDSMELWIYTLTTCSSVASIPVNIKVAKEKFGVPERISSFTIPLGSQMNYDGSVILYGCVIVFISQVVGHSLDIPTMFKIVGMSAILSTGGGGIPGSGIVKLFIMVEAFGLPTEIVGIIAAFYHIFDMGTTTNNCLGDLAGTIFVSRMEDKEAA